MKSIAIVILLLMVSCYIRLYNLDRYTLSYDEATVVVDSRGLTDLHPIHKVFNKSFVIRNHDYLTLYSHGFVYYWQKLFGNKEFNLRLSSVVFGILNIWVLYFFIGEFFGVKAAALVSLLLAISPMHLYYSQELRQYSAICLLTTFCAYFLIKALNNNKAKHWAAFALFNILNIYFHYFTLLTLFSFSIFFFADIKRYRHLLRNYALTCVAIAICVLPLLLVLFPNILFALNNKNIPEFNEFPSWGGKVSFQNVLFTIKNFSFGYNLDYYWPMIKIMTILVIILFVIGIWKYRNNESARLSVFCLIIPVAILFGVSSFSPCYVDRYLFNLLPFFLLIVAVGLNHLKGVFLVPIFILLVICNLWGLKNYYLDYFPGDYKQHIGEQRQNIRGLPEFVEANYEHGDIVLHTCRNTIFPLKFYAERIVENKDLAGEIGAGRLLFRFYNDERLLIFEYNKRHPITFFTGRHFLLDSEVRKGAKRLWVVYSSFVFHDTQTSEYALIKAMQNGFTQLFNKKFEGAALYLFAVKK